MNAKAKEYCIASGNAAFLCNDGQMRTPSEFADFRSEIRTFNYEQAHKYLSNCCLPQKRISLLKNVRETVQKTRKEIHTYRLTHASFMFDDGQDPICVKDLEIGVVTNNTGFTSSVIEEVYKVFEQIRRLKLQLPDRFNQLAEQVKECDRETLDLLHEIELSIFNACEGYQIAKKLQIIRKKRRIAKDELFILGKYLPVFEEINALEIEKAEKAVVTLNNRKYAPRAKSNLCEPQFAEYPRELQDAKSS